MVAVIRIGPSLKVIQTFEVSGGADTIGSVLRDLDHDGDPELVVQFQIGPIVDSGSCRAVLPIVYKCSMGGCSDQRSRFTDFYFQELDAVGTRLKAIEAIRDLSDDDFQTAVSCQVIERDRILRQLGLDKFAGLALAREWAASADPVARKRAAWVAADIDDPSATEILERLERDKDGRVSDIAAEALSKQKKQ